MVTVRPPLPDMTTHVKVIETAHEVGLSTTATIMFGHVDGPRNWARHLIAIRDLQQRTGGITEFVPLPFVHMEAPIYLKGRQSSAPRRVLLPHACRCPGTPECYPAPLSCLGCCHGMMLYQCESQDFLKGCLSPPAECAFVSQLTRLRETSESILVWWNAVW